MRFTDRLAAAAAAATWRPSCVRLCTAGRPTGSIRSFSSCVGNASRRVPAVDKGPRAGPLAGEPVPWEYNRSPGRRTGPLAGEPVPWQENRSPGRRAGPLAGEPVPWQENRSPGRRTGPLAPSGGQHEKDADSSNRHGGHNKTRIKVGAGGGSGIGRAVCQRFASEGALVVVADLDEEAANETLRSLSRDHKVQEHMAAVVDVSSKQSVENLVASIQRRYFQPASCVRDHGGNHA
ncbi:Short-chain dehydrogenase reductase 2a [Merluccius polli]|uniref:Short-chain dehydrogenase reductase 2a n=1 Tax=Merluccius polli TaxID=89951 RepID=A0AA47MMR5_MERPO|nr:Short-chain dehydrogenase reductase 2a [Merluccius polli]